MEGIDLKIQKLVSNPADPVYIEVARFYHSKGDSKEAIFTCLKALSKNPNHPLGRVQLSKIYLDLGFYTFALNELELAHYMLPENDSIKRLIEIISPGTLDNLKNKKYSSEEKILAEKKFDIKDLE